MALSEVEKWNINPDWYKSQVRDLIYQDRLLDFGKTVPTTFKIEKTRQTINNGIPMKENAFTPEDMDHILKMKEWIKQWFETNRDKSEYIDFLGIASDVVIAGGCFTSIFHGEIPKDVDIFILNNHMDLAYDPPEYQGYVRKEEQPNYARNPNILRIYDYKLRNDSPSISPKPQIMFTDYPDRKALVDNFDMRHCKVSYVPAEDKLYISKDVLNHIKDKILKIDGISYNAEVRKKKYLDRGFRPGLTLEEMAPDVL